MIGITNKLWFKLIIFSLLIFNIFALPKFLSIEKSNKNIELVSKTNWVEPSKIENSDKNITAEPTKPLYINIGFGNIDITDSEYDEASRQLLVPKGSVAWLTTSARMGEPGATLLYGHNSKEIFADLAGTPNNQIITLTGEDGRTYRYKKIKSEEVEPSDTSILYNLKQQKEQLITLTCSLDYFNSKRIITYFSREDK